jgi:hypothetical protein
MVTGNGIHKPTKGIRRVSLPGTTLYDDSFIDREEFVRLVIQSLKDVGYMCVTYHHLAYVPYDERLVQKGNCRDVGSRVWILYGDITSIKLSTFCLGGIME